MKLQRDSQDAVRTLGRLIRDDGTVQCVTLELPWRDNAHGVSCIPAGIYKAFRFNSPHIGYELFQLANVPDRVGIDIHIGNFPKDTEGCVLVGTTVGADNASIEGSRTAFAGFMQLWTGVDRFDLTVEDAPAPA